MRILAIETSCDDTAISLVEAEGSPADNPRFVVLDNIVSSQTEIHAHYGGVVPNIAKREHTKNLPQLFERIMNKELGMRDTADMITVTVGPGLEPALWTGIEFAKKLGEEMGVPVVGANHLEGHIYSNWLRPIGEIPISKSQYPIIVLLVSGGHTILLRMDSAIEWEKLGETRDDAVGEAFDKVARMLDLPYPGGPEIEKLAHEGSANAIDFPRPMLKEQNYEFSFSGLKTSVLYHLRSDTKNANSMRMLRKDEAADIAASFQQAVFDTLIGKTMRAVEEFSAQTVLLCGGVAANTTLRQQLQVICDKRQVTFSAPPMTYNTDNAAMIAVAAYMRHISGKDSFPLVANGHLGL